MSLTIPVILKGTSPGVLKGGKLQQKLRKVKVTALPDKLPEEVVIDISGLDINDSIRAVSYTHLRALETVLDLVCRLLLENKIHQPPRTHESTHVDARHHPPELKLTLRALFFQ